MKVKQVQTRKKEGAAGGFRAARRERQSSPAAFNPIELLSRSTEEDYPQAKLKIGSPGDIYEQEADQTAERVMSMPGSVAQRQIEEEEEPIQARPIAEQITPLVQRQAEEEEESVQEKSLLQRQAEEEEEPIQEKSVLQFQDEDEEEPVQEKSLIQRQPEEEEEPIQEKSLLQRQAEEEEEPIQEKSLLQRQDEEEEEPVQEKPLLQRQTEEEEESVQEKSFVQRQLKEEEEEQQYEEISVSKKDIERIKETGKERYQWKSWEDISAKPYLPGKSEYSEIYHRLSPKCRSMVNETIDYIYLQRLSCPIPKLDWFKPTHRPWARRWLRIRDKVMGELWEWHKRRTSPREYTVVDMTPPPKKQAPRRQDRLSKEEDMRLICEACKKAQKEGGIPSVLRNRFDILAIHPDDIKEMKQRYKKPRITILIPWYSKTGESPLERFGESSAAKEPKKEVSLPPPVRLIPGKFWVHGQIGQNYLVVEFISPSLKSICGLDYPVLFLQTQLYVCAELLDSLNKDLWEHLLYLADEDKQLDSLEAVTKRAEAILRERKEDEKRFLDEERKNLTEIEIAECMYKQWRQWRKSFRKELEEEFPDDRDAVNEVAENIERKMLAKELLWLGRWKPGFPPIVPSTSRQKRR